MKIIYILMLTLLLASCGSSPSVENESNEASEAAVEETTNQINAEINNLDVDSNTWVTESDLNIDKVVKIDAKYKNPKWDVDMVISYTLADNWTIKTIDVSATTYDLKKYNDAIQVLVGKTIDDAKKFEISWGSLVTEAFRNAIK